MSLLRWKAQSLQFHWHLTGPASKAARQGILPAFAHLAFIIASCGGAVAGMAKKAWRDDDRKHLDLDRLKGLRKRINTAFDHLEAIIERRENKPISAIRPENADIAAANYDLHGSFAMLALAAMEEASEMAVPLMSVAEGSKTLENARQEIEFESADVRVNLHIISEKARVCSETSTQAKWAKIRERYPEEVFQVPAHLAAPDKASNSKRNKNATLSQALHLL